MRGFLSFSVRFWRVAALVVTLWGGANFYMAMLCDTQKNQLLQARSDWQRLSREAQETDQSHKAMTQLINDGLLESVDAARVQEILQQATDTYHITLNQADLFSAQAMPFPQLEEGQKQHFRLYPVVVQWEGQVDEESLAFIQALRAELPGFFMPQELALYRLTSAGHEGLPGIQGKLRFFLVGYVP